MRCRTIIASVLLTGALALGVASAGAGDYSDPAGDASSGPDITTVHVTDDGAGTITMQIAVPLAVGNALFVLIDRNLTCTVSVCDAGFWWRDGGGYALLVQNVSGTVSATGGRLDTGANVHLQATPSLRVSATETTVELRFAKAELGIDSSFGFVISTVISQGQTLWSDAAPDSREYQGDTLYNYVLGTGATTTPPAPPTTTSTTPASASAPARELTVFLFPVIGKPTIVPAQLVAGKRVTVSFRVTRGDNQKPLAAGTIIGEPSIAGKVIRHAQSFRVGVARLSFVVPKTGKGKVLRVKVTIKAPSYQGEDGAYVDLASGQTGVVHTYYSGRSATKVVTFSIRR